MREGYALLIAVVTLSLVMITLMVLIFAAPRWVGYVHLRKVEREKAKLATIAELIRTWYAVNAASIEASSDAVLSGDVVIENGENWESVAEKLKVPYLKDEWGRPYSFFVSPRMVSGDVAYHVVAVVSAGPDGRLESSFSGGELSLSGDDLGVVISGAVIESRFAVETRNRIQRLAGAVVAHAKVVAKRVGIPGMNYFCKTGCSSDIPCAGEIDCVRGAALVDTGIPEILGIPPENLKDAWGGDLLFDNLFTTSGPPWGFRIGFHPPWGGERWYIFVVDLM